jgi:hypothetical protein
MQQISAPKMQLADEMAERRRPSLKPTFRGFAKARRHSKVTNNDTDPNVFRLLDLPAELRDSILEHALHSPDPIPLIVLRRTRVQRTTKTLGVTHPFGPAKQKYDYKQMPSPPALAFVSRGIRAQTLKIWYRINTFAFELPRQIPGGFIGWRDRVGRHSAAFQYMQRITVSWSLPCAAGYAPSPAYGEVCFYRPPGARLQITFGAGIEGECVCLFHQHLLPGALKLPPSRSGLDDISVLKVAIAFRNDIVPVWRLYNEGREITNCSGCGKKRLGIEGAMMSMFTACLGANVDAVTRWKCVGLGQLRYVAQAGGNTAHVFD